MLYLQNKYSSFSANLSLWACGFSHLLVAVGISKAHGYLISSPNDRSLGDLHQVAKTSFLCIQLRIFARRQNDLL